MKKFSPRVIMRKLSTDKMPVKERKTSLREFLVKTGLSRFITLPSFEGQSFANNCQVDSSSWEYLNTDLEQNCKDKNVQTIHKKEVIRNNPELLSKSLSQDSLYASEYGSSSTLESSSIKIKST